MFGERMVKEYLDRTKQEFLEQKLMIQKDIAGSQNRMKENAKFIEILEDTNDPSYDAFTPRETNSFNRKKIAELQENQKIELKHLSTLQDELNIVENKIDEISNVIHDFSQDSYRQNSIDFHINQLRMNDRKMHRLSKRLIEQSDSISEQVEHHMNLCMKLIDVDPERTKLELSEIHSIFHSQQQWIKNYSYELYPGLDDGIPFEQKVQQLIEHLKIKDNLSIDFHTSGTSYRLDDSVQVTILCAIKELCKNVLEHSETTNVKIGLTFEPDDVLLNVSDSGNGFNYDAFTQNTEYGVTKLGLYLLEHRVSLLNGKVEIESAMQKGCSIKVYIPKISI